MQGKADVKYIRSVIQMKRKIFFIFGKKQIKVTDIKTSNVKTLSYEFPSENL